MKSFSLNFVRDAIQFISVFKTSLTASNECCHGNTFTPVRHGFYVFMILNFWIIQFWIIFRSNLGGFLSLGKIDKTKIIDPK